MSCRRKLLNYLSSKRNYHSNDRPADQERGADLTYGHHLIAFLDLLGQKELLCQIEGILDEGRPELQRKKLELILTQTIGTIGKFRKSFLDFFNEYLNKKVPSKIPKEFEPLYQQLGGHAKINLLSFSDSTIAWMPVQIKNEFDYAKVLNSIHGVLAAVGMLTPLFLSKKKPFRGGIELEGAIPLTSDGNEIYGPALNQAYYLESKVAEYPRVLIGKRLLEFLDHIDSVPFQNNFVKSYCKSMTEACKGWIILDEDQLSMIHFLGPSARKHIQNMPEVSNYYEDFLMPLKIFIMECEERFEGNDKLKSRYQRLKAYYDKYIGDWEK